MDKFNLPKGLLDAVSNVVGGSRKQQAEQSSQFKQAMEQKYKPTTLRPLPAESLAEQPKRENKDAALHSSIREIFVKSATAAQQEQQSAVGRINSMYARTGAARPVAEAKAHTVPKTEKEKDLAALAKPKDKITHKDVMVGRGVVAKEEIEQVAELNKSTVKSYIAKKMDRIYSASAPGKAKAKKDTDSLQRAHERVVGNKPTSEEVEQVGEGNNPFDYKNYKSQIPTKPGEKAGFDSKKISTGTVYTRKPVKESIAAAQHLERAKAAKTEGEKHGHMIEHHLEMARVHNQLNDKWQSDNHFDLAKKHADQLTEISKKAKLDEDLQAVLEKITVVHGHPPAGQSYDQTKTDGGITSGIRYMPPSQKPAGAQNKPQFRPTNTAPAGSKSDSPGLQNALARLKSAKARGGMKNEEKDTPGNGYEHQCAIHVKHAKLGEGRTLFSQHAEPAEDGTIAWYDIMFEHGIEKQVPTTDLEIVVSESHMNHKKKKM